MATKQYETVKAAELEPKLQQLLEQNASFYVEDIKRGEMARYVSELEKAMKAQGLKVRTYTAGRLGGVAAGIPVGLAVAAGVLAPPVGLAVAAGIAAHNVATRKPDYEIAKYIFDNKLKVEFVGWDKDAADVVIGTIQSSIAKAGNAVYNIVGTATNTTKDVVYWADDIRKELFSPENITKTEQAIANVAHDSWKYAKEQPQKIAEKYNKMDKGYKVLVMTAMAGSIASCTAVALPFVIAVLPGVPSIVSALALLGGGAITSGGFGVAGGIIVTASGPVLSASVTALLAQKLIRDPELDELLEDFEKVEVLISENFIVMEKHQQKYKGLYEKYAKISKFVMTLQEQIENGQKYDVKEVRQFATRVKELVDDLQTALSQEEA